MEHWPKICIEVTVYSIDLNMTPLKSVSKIGRAGRDPNTFLLGQNIKKLVTQAADLEKIQNVCSHEIILIITIICIISHKIIRFINMQLFLPGTCGKQILTYLVKTMPPEILKVHKKLSTYPLLSSSSQRSILSLPLSSHLQLLWPKKLPPLHLPLSMSSMTISW